MSRYPLPFSKMQACGNDFVVLNDTARAWVGQESALARALCNRRFGVGADGLMMVRQLDSSVGLFELVFVNSDGLIGEMCGNGARCVARFVRDHDLCVQDKWTLQTAAGPVHVEFLSDQQIQLALPPPLPWRPAQELWWQDQAWTLHAVHIGPPHVVCILPSSEILGDVALDNLGPFVRHHEWYAPSGCNFNIVRRIAENRLQLRTYERGVEQETLGCGTGAVASVWVLHQLGMASAHTTVLTSSGESIAVDVSNPIRPLLAGQAHPIAHGCLDAEWLAHHHLAPSA